MIRTTPSAEDRLAEEGLRVEAPAMTRTKAESIALAEEGMGVETDPFAKATPRPWRETYGVIVSDTPYSNGVDEYKTTAVAYVGEEMRHAAGLPYGAERDANAALIVAAVNAYGQPTELERELTAALRQLSDAIADEIFLRERLLPASVRAMNSADAVLAKATEQGL